MALPEFRQDGWLPDGHHNATWDDIQEKFAGAPQTPRRAVYDRLCLWRDAARQVGLTGTLILNGSFISSRPDPGDFDTVFVYDEECEDILTNDPAARQLIDLKTCNANGDDVLAFARQNMIDYPQFYQIDCFDEDSRTGVVKGVLEVDL